MAERSVSKCKSGFTVLDLLALLTVCVVLVALTLPALVRATERSDSISKCLANAKGVVDAVLVYVADHHNTMPTDGRDLNPDDEIDWVWYIATSEQTLASSWFGKLEGYLSADPDALDCPIVDDQRKGEWWPTDYVLNRWGINTNPDVADDPARAVLVGEPNMARGTVRTLGDIIAWSDWGPRPDLEQNQVGSLSFGFVDGHASRIAIPEGDSPHLADYPQIQMAKPGAADYESNYLWWTADQLLPSGN